MKKTVLRKSDKNIEGVLLRIKREGGVNITLQEEITGDNYITIRTKTYETRIGVNDLGFWLVYDRKYR